MPSKSRDLQNRFFQIQMIQNEIFNVFRGWKYEFLRICRGPDRARSPQGPTRAQGRARSPQGPTRAQGPAGPDPRRAPPGPRAPQGPIPAGPHQGPGEGPGPRGGPKGGPRGGPTRAQGPMLLKCDFFIIINASIICVYNMRLLYASIICVYNMRL